MADAIEEWLDLLQNGPEELKIIARARCEKSNVFNDVTIAANILHPKYRGVKLDPTHHAMFEDYIM